MKKQFWECPEPFKLESGQSISKLTLAYHTWGELNADQSNVVWVFHALTANSNPAEWWKGLIGEYDLISPADHFIICVNAIGSPYGSSSPQDLSFPEFTVRDVVRSQLLLSEHLGIERIKLAMGGSFGGSQAMEFAYAFSGEIDRLVLVACSARETAWGIAIHQAQRLALKADQSFGQLDGGKSGLKAARGIGLLTYRTPDTYIETQSDKDDRISNFRAASYIDYQGKKLVARFTSLSYYYLLQCLDTHNLGRNRGGEHNALQQITSPTLVIGIDTDALQPCELQRKMAQSLPHGTYAEVTSSFGHDGFLIETEQIAKWIRAFMG